MPINARTERNVPAPHDPPSPDEIAWNVGAPMSGTARACRRWEVIRIELSLPLDLRVHQAILVDREREASEHLPLRNPDVRSCGGVGDLAEFRSDMRQR